MDFNSFSMHIDLTDEMKGHLLETENEHIRTSLEHALDENTRLRREVMEKDFQISQMQDDIDRLKTDLEVYEGFEQDDPDYDSMEEEEEEEDENSMHEEFDNFSLKDQSLFHPSLQKRSKLVVGR